MREKENKKKGRGFNDDLKKCKHKNTPNNKFF